MKNENKIDIVNNSLNFGFRIPKDFKEVHSESNSKIIYEFENDLKEKIIIKNDKPTLNEYSNKNNSNLLKEHDKNNNLLLYEKFKNDGNTMIVFYNLSDSVITLTYTGNNDLIVDDVLESIYKINSNDSNKPRSNQIDLEKFKNPFSNSQKTISTIDELIEKFYSVDGVFMRGGVKKSISYPVLIYRDNNKYFVTMVYDAYLKNYPGGQDAPSGFIVYNENDSTCQYLNNKTMEDYFGLPMQETFAKPIYQNHDNINSDEDLLKLFEKNVLNQKFNINLYIEYIDNCIKTVEPEKVRYYEMFKDDILKSKNNIN